jgi:two-component system KDP operon response regulator KdpE
MTTRNKAHKDRIVVISAEPQIQRLLKSILVADGYQVLVAADVSTSTQTGASNPPQLVVLDLDPPGLTARDAITETRRRLDAPLVTLSSQLAEANVVAALDLGADDYIGKPFRTGELLARIRSVLRRDIKAKGEKAFYQNGALEVDILKHIITRRGEPIELAPTEFEILSQLVRNVGRIVPHQKFLESEHGRHSCRNRAALRSAVWALRQKIEENPRTPRIILTEERIGYRLARNSENAPLPGR